MHGWKTQHRKVVNFPKIDIYIPIQISARFFCRHRQAYSKMYTLNTTQMFFTRQWLNKLWDIHTIEYHLVTTTTTTK